MDLEEIEGLKSLRDRTNTMTLEEIEQRRIPFEGQVSVEQADWLIAEIKRLREENKNLKELFQSPKSAIGAFNKGYLIGKMRE